VITNERVRALVELDREALMAIMQAARDSSDPLRRDPDVLNMLFDAGVLLDMWGYSFPAREKLEKAEGLAS
jgi:hypothetical protein